MGRAFGREGTLKVAQSGAGPKQPLEARGEENGKRDPRPPRVFPELRILKDFWQTDSGSAHSEGLATTGLRAKTEVRILKGLHGSGPSRPGVNECKEPPGY